MVWEDIRNGWRGSHVSSDFGMTFDMAIGPLRLPYSRLHMIQRLRWWIFWTALLSLYIGLPVLLEQPRIGMLVLYPSFSASCTLQELVVLRQIKMICIHSGNGTFTVRSLYKVLTCQNHISFPLKCVWRSEIPFEVAFSVWTAYLGITLDNL